MKHLQWAIPLAAISVVGILAVVVLVLATRGEKEQPELAVSDSGIPPPAGGHYIVEGGYWASPSEGESARRSDLIAVAEVEQQLTPFWSTPDGLRPQLSDRELLRTPGYRIFTPYELQITQELKGEGPVGGKIQLIRLGGQIGEDIVVVEEGLFGFKPETKVLVFLRDCGDARAEKFGSAGYRYRIINRFVLDDKGGFLESDHDLNEMIEVVEREGTLEAKGGVIECG